MKNSVKDSHIEEFEKGFGGIPKTKGTLAGTPEKSKLPHYLSLFFISPVLALISGIANFKDRGAKIILVLFLGVVGYTILLHPGADSYTIHENFVYHYQNVSFSEFLNEIQNLISLKTSNLYGGYESEDLYMPLVSFTVSRITDNSRWLFTIMGLIYGCFYIAGISLVYSEIQQRWSPVITVLFIFFISLVAINGINAPRTHTANWIFFCGVYLYFKTENIKYIFLTLMAPLAHIGFIAMVLPFVGYLLLGHRKYIYIILLAISFFASAHMSFIEPVLSATDLGETKMQQYTGEHWDERLEREASKNLSFHAKYYGKASNFSIQFMLIASFFLSGYLSGKHHDDLLNALAGISILLLSFSNFVSPVIPVLGSRLFLQFSIFALAYLIRLYVKNFEALKSRHWIIHLCLPAIFLFLFTEWSITGNFVDFKALLSPILYPFLGDDPVSIKEFIRQILG